MSYVYVGKETVTVIREIHNRICNGCGAVIPENHAPDLEVTISEGSGEENLDFHSYACLAAWATRQPENI